MRAANRRPPPSPGRADGPPTVGSLFSGIGGIDLGFQWAGFRTAWFCEVDPFCQRVLAKHWPGVPCYGDIRTVTDAPAVDIIAGGFPCQPFSIAGRQRGTADHRDLWPEMRRVIEIVRPRWVVCENVPHFLNLAFARTATDLEALGYEVGEPLVFQAGSVGAWHPRARCWIAAHAEGDGRGSGRARRSFAGITGEPKQALWHDADAARITRHGRSAQAPREHQGRRPQRSVGGCPGDERDRVGWEREPAMARVVHGVSAGMDRDRIRVLGNAVVPQCAAVIARAILAAEGVQA